MGWLDAVAAQLHHKASKNTKVHEVVLRRRPWNEWRYAPGESVEFRSWRATAVRYWHNRPAEGRTGAATEPDETLEEAELREPLFGMP